MANFRSKIYFLEWKYQGWKKSILKRAIVHNSRSLTLVHTCLPVFDWIFTQKTGQFKECRGSFWSIEINLSHKEICVLPSPWMWIMNCDPCLWTWFFRHESCISWTILTSEPIVDTLGFWEKRGNYHFASFKVEIATSLTLLVYKQNSNPSNLSVSKSTRIQSKLVQSC